MKLEQTDSSSGEGELVRAAQRGDAEAFKRLYESYRDRVYNLIFYWLGDRALAEDVLQSVFLKVHRGLGGFRFESSLATWIYRVAANECRNQTRRRVAQMVPLEDVLGSGDEIDPGPLQEDQRATSERQEIIRQAIMELPADLRAVVVLKYHEGLSYEEIAAVLGCAPGTVASRLNRALGRLESQLKPVRRLL
jgi:RNA polymerase sigma-70 factor (ECF subfamily)